MEPFIVHRQCGSGPALPLTFWVALTHWNCLIWFQSHYQYFPLCLGVHILMYYATLVLLSLFTFLDFFPLEFDHLTFSSTWCVLCVLWYWTNLTFPLVNVIVFMYCWIVAADSFQNIQGFPPMEISPKELTLVTVSNSTKPIFKLYFCLSPSCLEFPTLVCALPNNS